MISAGCAVVRLREAQRDFLKISLILDSYGMNCEFLNGAIMAIELAINLITESN